MARLVALCLLFSAAPGVAQTEGAAPSDPLAAAILGVAMADPAKLDVPATPPAETWPRLPTDGELAAAMNDYATRLGVAIPTVRVTLGEPVKLSAPVPVLTTVKLRVTAPAPTVWVPKSV